MKRNPYTITLVVIGVLAGITAMTLAFLANVEADRYNASLSAVRALGAGADILMIVTIVALVGALVAAAATWSPTAAAERKRGVPGT